MVIPFYKLEVSKVRHETKDAVSISFFIPEELKETFKYKAGQFLTFKFDINGVEARRSYSMSSAPGIDTDLTITVKSVEKGFASNYLTNNAREGDIIEVLPPRGKFTVDPSQDEKRLHVFFSAGSGITPIFSIIKFLLAFEPQSNLILNYSNSYHDKIIFKKELDTLEEKYSAKFKINYFLTKPHQDWTGLKGRIDQSFVKKVLKENANNALSEIHYYLCGPHGMMESVEKALKDMNIEKKQIHKESFGALFEPEGKETMAQETTGKKEIKVKIYGETHSITVEPDEVILIAAMAAGLDPPFNCQIGACASCRAKLVTGKVHMDEREALTDEEIDYGYILTCQSHPLSDDVFVDYDD